MSVTGGAATYGEIQTYLSSVPAASASWAAGLYGLRLPIGVVARLIETMSADYASPLRQAEDGIMAKEVRYAQMERGIKEADDVHSGRPNLAVGTVLSVADQVRVRKLVGGYANPVFKPKSTFISNGHSVANAVRRVASQYLFSRVPKGATVVEVGPDEKNWLLAASEGITAAALDGRYQGARPIIGPRDSLRAMGWRTLAKAILVEESDNKESLRAARAEVMLRDVEKVFPRRKVQDLVGDAEYILSTDANYDIGFDDMPKVMRKLGTRVWMGHMSRAKGLTRRSRLLNGSLDLMGTAFRVDWEKDKISFSQYECSAFGYDHKVSEYLRYEEHNGYAWDIDGESFVYSKMPETNSEILFFCVVRVPRLSTLIEPRFVENPFAGQVKLKSLWAVGDEVSGLPTSFERIVFFADALSFSKVLEKRAMLGDKGSLTQTLAFVRSTNVRFWLNGTPVSSNGRVGTRVSEAAAIVVEAMAAERRLVVGKSFQKAMGEFRFSVKRGHWFLKLLDDLIGFRVVIGSVAKTLVDSWDSLRKPLVDRAVADLRDVTVSSEVVDDHLGLGIQPLGCLHGLDGVNRAFVGCVCSRVADIKTALGVADEKDKREFRLALASLETQLPCKECTAEVDACVADVGMETTERAPTSSVGSSTTAASEVDSCFDQSRDDVDSISSVAGEDESVTSECGGDSCDSHAGLAMQEFVDLEEYLMGAMLSECKADATLVLAHAPRLKKVIMEASTTRVKHAAVLFQSGRAIQVVAASVCTYGAVYDLQRDSLVPVRYDGTLMRAKVPDGWYYTCDRLRVWNSPSLVSAVRVVAGSGRSAGLRDRYSLVLGVPGAGKTYKMMQRVAAEQGKSGKRVLVLSVTRESAETAARYGEAFGVATDVLEKRVMTLDSYLINKKISADVLHVDEFTMVHIGKVDAAAVLCGARRVCLYGDGKQIQYDPFTKEFPVHHSRLGVSVPESRIEFLPETHRCPRDVCAAYVDCYPAFYPCQCCRKGEKESTTLRWRRANMVDVEEYATNVRYHTYKQEEKIELQTQLGMSADLAELRKGVSGGLATVGEDQGTTHRDVVTYRLFTTYDKAAKRRGATLFNRVEYVLTDMTRHTGSYTYITLSEEKDEVIRRIELSRDSARLAAVDAKVGFNKVSVLSLIA